ncbi:MAG: sigma 54-interacting transcriptional regulator [Candidatus Dependentiae bacterium]|nr:sigma 54-interacting transcriptional regulator [Candidatus Dependentiae bacterium]
MTDFLTIFQYCIHFFTSAYVVIPLQIISLIILASIIINLTKHLSANNALLNKKTLFLFFIVPILAIMLENLSWIAIALDLQSAFAHSVTRAIVCLAWILSCIKFHSLALFLEQLTEKNFILKWYHKLFFAFEFMLCVAFVAYTITLTPENQHSSFSTYIYRITVTYWFISITPSLVCTLKKLSCPTIPIVLKEQLKFLLFYFIFPHIICIILEFLPKILFSQKHNLTFANIGIIFITASLYYCFKRIMQFRFLNLSNHVQAKPDINITTNFKDTIEQINVACNENEIEYITQNFFSEQFLIPKNRVNTYIRSNTEPQNTNQQIIEGFVSSKHADFNTVEIFLQHKILVAHEIEFDDFHTENPMISHLAEFLRKIECDIFLPILNNKKLIGYITIKKDITQTIYNIDQQNKMIVLAQFLAPAIYLFQHNNVYALLQETKEVKEELYAKNQEVSQYKESIKKLLKDRLENHIGVIFYKAKHFSFKNAEAQKLLGVNPNLQQSHPTSATLSNFAQQVEKFQTAQTTYMTIHDGSKLMISGMPHAEPSGGVMLIIRNPEATDIIKMQFDSLGDHSKRDYLLYLETTKAGKAINKLLPSNQEIILNAKIQLLQASLQKSALLLEMHQNDITAIVDIIYQISEKETIHTLSLEHGQQECGMQLFGLNPLLSLQKDVALLEKHNDGILVIKNIEFMDKTSQQMIAYFIRYGIYTPLKSEQRKFSNARIIFSTSHNLQSLSQEGIIIPELYAELKKSSKTSILSLPSLVTMDHQDLSLIIDGFMYQNLQEAGNKGLIPLTIKEKDYLIAKRIPSLFEFKQKIQTLMFIKSQDLVTPLETSSKIKIFDATCPELQLASQLGKHALKDTQLMASLWKKLGNQTKIAELLGVNRSSVNRRCKDYKLN